MRTAASWCGSAYNTGPDTDVLIGAEFKPFYAADRGKDLGVTTWPPQAWKIGGGNVWGWITYDAELNTLYHGTGNPGPWNAEQRPGDNKWTAGIFARDPHSGAAHWYYQFSPHDEHDYDGINEQILLDMPFGGKMRKVLVHLRSQRLRLCDRSHHRPGAVGRSVRAGQLDSKGIDLQPGGPIINPDKADQARARWCATSVRRHRAPRTGIPAASARKPGLLYIPHENMCMDWMNMQVNYIGGTPYVGAEVHMKPGPGGNRGELTAWDPVLRKPVWVVKENFPIWSGTVVTAGDLVFYGTMDGWFKAVNAQDRRARCGASRSTAESSASRSATAGPTVINTSRCCRGVGGWSGAVVSGPVDPRDGSAALGMVNVMSDLPKYTTAGGTLYVFSLPH